MAVPSFDPLQARTLTDAFLAEGVDFLLIGKGAAILMGYPGMTQDVDVFLPKTLENSQKVVRALRNLGFALTESQETDLLRGKDFVQLKSGPFDVDLVYAPDGLPDYATVKKRSVRVDRFPLARLDDIIASKEAAGRQRDLMDLPLLRVFQRAYEQQQLQQQQQQQALPAEFSKQAPEPIDADISNAAAQAELLRAEQLSLQYNSQLAFYAQAKAQQIDALQASLQTAINSQATKITTLELDTPVWPAGRKTRVAWQNQLAQSKTRLAQLERRSERVGEIAQEAGLYADSLLAELAARKLRFHQPELARQWDALQQQQRKAALQNRQPTQSLEPDLGRTRSLSFSSDS